MILKKMLNRESIKGKKGVSLVLVALMIFTLVGIVALAIDVGHLMATRNELQNVADGAALAGATYLGSVYKGLSYSEQQGYTFSEQQVEELIEAVNQVAEKNKASGESISINENDITIGIWDPDPDVEDVTPETLVTPDAVKVIARRDNDANSPITTFFAGIFGMNTMNVTANAVAALTGPAVIAEGELNTPFSISERFFPNCLDTISFSPAASCAGWHNFFDSSHSNSAMNDMMLGFIEGHNSCKDCEGLIFGHEWLTNNFDFNPNQYPDATVTPETSIGDEFNHNGGTNAAHFGGGMLPASYDGNTFDKVNDTIIGDEKHPAPFIALFDYFRYRDGDGDNSIWTTTVPVYKEENAECQDNPQNWKEIVGFAEIEVIRPNGPPSSTITVLVDCNFSVIEGRGGGGIYGNLRGSIPNLVK